MDFQTVLNNKGQCKNSSKKEKSGEDNLPNSLFMGAQNAKGKKNEKFQNYEFTKTQSLMTSHRV